MSPKQFKTIARQLKKVYEELAREAEATGVNTLSSEYQEAIDKARLLVLENAGFTLEQYREAKAKLESFSQEDLLDEYNKVKTQIQELVNKIESLYIPSEDRIKEISTEVAESTVKAPQIINQIVKEVKTIEPQTIDKTEIVKEEYDDTMLKAELELTKKRIDELKIPAVKTDEELKQFFHDNFSENFEKNINTLGMPDFRKLAMGLQAQIDEIASSTTAAADWTDEAVSGTINGSNVTFTLTSTPTVPASLILTLNRQIQIQDTDYTLSGNTITYTTAPDALYSGLPHRAKYQ